MTMPDQTSPQPRWTKGRLFLAASLVLNVLFVGSMLGAGWMRHHHDWRRGGPPNPDRFIDRIVADLPAARRETVRGIMKDDFQKVRGKFEAMRTSRDALLEALTAETFDAGKIRAAANPLLRLRGELEADRVELLISVMQGLDVGERQQLLKSRFFRRMVEGKWGKRHGPPPPPPE